MLIYPQDEHSETLCVIDVHVFDAGFMKLGYQIALINFNLRGRSLAHSINASGAKTLVVGRGTLIGFTFDIQLAPYRSSIRR